MRFGPAILVFVACSSNGTTDDTSPADTDDAPYDTDTSDTDVQDTDTDTPPEEDFCTFTQCGGDVVGVWNILGSCIELPPYNAYCPTATIEYHIDTTGTWTFDAGGTYQINGTAAYTIVTTFPAECNEALSYTECSQWEPVDLPTTECTGDVAVECTCTITQPALPFVDSGTWTYTGEDVTIVSGGYSRGKGGGFPLQYEICQEGDRLDLELKGPFVLGYTLERTLDR